MPLLLDNNQFKDAYKEIIRQTLVGHQEAACELGITITPRFRMKFSGVLVAKSGLNALSRITLSTASGERVSVSEEQPYVETSSRRGSQDSAGTEHSEVTGTDTQDGTSSEKNEQHSKGGGTETGSTNVSATETGLNKTDSTSQQTTASTEAQSSEQSQSQGTVQTTTANYSR